MLMEFSSIFRKFTKIKKTDEKFIYINIYDILSTALCAEKS